MKKSSTPQPPYREMLKNLRAAMRHSMSESKAPHPKQQPELKPQQRLSGNTPSDHVIVSAGKEAKDCN